MNKIKKISVLTILTIIISGCAGEDNEINDSTNNSTGNEIENQTDADDENNENLTTNQVSEDENAMNNSLNEEESNDTIEVDEEVEMEEELQINYQMDGVAVRPIDDAPAEVVLLTIDDAPDKYGLEMAEILAEIDASAIFFVNGHFLQTDEKKEELKKIYEMGFEIGNHTMSHPSLPELSEEEQRQEIVELNDLVEEIIGERPRFFRAPFGANTDYSREVVIEEGMHGFNWSYGYDWEADYREKEALTEIMVQAEALSNGANLLMHDREWTKEALEDIVNGLREKGYEIVNTREIKSLGQEE